jgi:hypothetical protein
MHAFTESQDDAAGCSGSIVAPYWQPARILPDLLRGQQNASVNGG